MISRCVACAALPRLLSLSTRCTRLAVLPRKIERCQTCPGEYVLSQGPTLESAWQHQLLSRHSGRRFTCYVAMKNSARRLSPKCSGSAETTGSYSTSLMCLSWLLLSVFLPNGLRAAFLSMASRAGCFAARRHATRPALSCEPHSPGEQCGRAAGVAHGDGRGPRDDDGHSSRACLPPHRYTAAGESGPRP